jgi:phosphatidylserine synthase
VPLYFVVCCATRLARFNVQTVRADKRYFVGLALSGGGRRNRLHPPGRAAGGGTAVAARRHGRSRSPCSAASWSRPSATGASKSLDFRQPHSYRMALPLAAMILLLAFYPEAFLPVMALAYALSGPVLWLAQS